MRPVTAACRRLRRQDGQVLPLVAIWLVVLLLMAGFVVDFGRVWVAQRQLQSAVDAAALVAGQNLPDATKAYASAVSYSGAAGAKNEVGGFEVTPQAPTVTFMCVSHAPNYAAGSPPTCPTDTSSASCAPAGTTPPQPTGATTCNAVKVQESATVRTIFAGIVLPSFTVTASASAAARGGAARPVNAYVILDNTGSMTSGCASSVTGISRNPSRLDCAKAGVRALLQALWPCSPSLASCGSTTLNTGGQLGANVASPFDEVGLLVFPAISGNPPTSSALNAEIDCNRSSRFSTTYPVWASYTYNAAQPDGGIPTSDDYLGYQAVGLSSDFRPSVANTNLNATSSDVVEAVDWGKCPSGAYPGGDYYGLKDIAGQGSYLAGAITEAQHLLNLNSRPGVSNAIVVLSDGQLNKPRTFTDNNPCNSAIDAAAQAKAAGTVIYAIAYGASGSCPDRNYSHTALQTMQDIASNAGTFFNQPTTGDLTQSFQQVGTELSNPRLIPDCTAAPPGC